MAKIKNKKPLNNPTPWLGGRKPKIESKLHDYIYGFKLTEEENNLFRERMKESGAKTKTQFITNCIFDRPFHKVITNPTGEKITQEISNVNLKIRLLGIDYNDLTKAIKTAFTEKRALSLLGKLEQVTVHLVGHLQKVTEIIERCEKK